MTRSREGVPPREAINEGLADHRELQAEAAKERREMTYLEQVLEKAGGEKATQLRDILKRVREGERVARFEIEVAQEKLPSVVREIFYRATAYFEDNKGGRIIADRASFPNHWDDEVYYVPQSAPVVGPDEASYEQDPINYANSKDYFKGQPNELLRYDFGKNFVRRGETKKIYSDYQYPNEERPEDALTESAVLEKAKKGWGWTMSGRKLELDGNKLTMDFSGNPSSSFFEEVLGGAVLTSEPEGEGVKHTFHEPSEIGDVKFVPETEEDKKRRETNATLSYVLGPGQHVK